MFVMHLGYDCLKKVMEILGRKHDFSNISDLLQTVEKERVNLGRFEHSQASKDKIAEA